MLDQVRRQHCKQVQASADRLLELRREPGAPGNDSPAGAFKDVFQAFVGVDRDGKDGCAGDGVLAKKGERVKERGRHT